MSEQGAADGGGQIGGWEPGVRKRTDKGPMAVPIGSQGWACPQVPYYLTTLNHTLIIGISHHLITKYTQLPKTSTRTLLFTHKFPLSKHNIHQCQPYQPTIFFLYSLFITLYFFYNNKHIPMICPFYTIHKLVLHFIPTNKHPPSHETKSTYHTHKPPLKTNHSNN